MKVVITGSNSNLGKKLTRIFLKNNFTVYCFSNSLKTCNLKKLKIIKYNNKINFNKNFFNQNRIDIIIICSHDRKDIQINNNSNLKSISKLVDYAKNNVKKIIYISSLAASIDAKSNYGKIKFQIEREIKKYTTIIRPGMFFEKENCDALQKLFIFIKIFRIFPFILKRSYSINFVEINELASKIFELSLKSQSGKYAIFNETAISLSDIIKNYSNKNNYRIKLLPIPFFVFNIFFNLIKPINSIYSKIDPIYNVIIQKSNFESENFNKIPTKLNYKI